MSRVVAKRYAMKPAVSEPVLLGAGSLVERDRGAPVMKGIILRAATVLLATIGYIGVGIALASVG
jgi:hypothetical protein